MANNVDLWTLIFHYHWNWVCLAIVLGLFASPTVMGRK